MGQCFILDSYGYIIFASIIVVIGQQQCVCGMNVLLLEEACWLFFFEVVGHLANHNQNFNKQVLGKIINFVINKNYINKK